MRKEGVKMRDEYDFSNARKNPYAKKMEKQQVTINLDKNIILYFKSMANDTGVPYQTLINLYLDQCVKEEKKLTFI